jgi:hypothetical protein
MVRNRLVTAGLLGAALLMLAAPTAKAVFTLGLPGDATAGVTGFTDSSWPMRGPDPAQIAAILGLPALGSLLHKFEYKAGVVVEEGSLAGSYAGAFNPTDGSGIATITHAGGTWASATALLAKGGSYGHWVFDLRGWDGRTAIVINDLWPQQGTFSHVEFYGTPIPEPATILAGAVLLLPFGISAFRFVRRNKIRRT